MLHTLKIIMVVTFKIKVYVNIVMVEHTFCRSIFLTRKLALINYISALCINFLKKYTYKVTLVSAQIFLELHKFWTRKGFEVRPLFEFSCKKCVSSYFGSQVKVLRKCERVCMC